MNKVTLVRDPVYNYVEITPIERCIVDQPAFQRLRFVLQNSTAFLTYPANFNSRFLHSLGVMHLSGLMFVRALQATTNEVLDRFLAQCGHLVGKYQNFMSLDRDEVLAGWRASLGNASGFNHRPRSSKLRDLSEEDLFLINTIWQSVRLTALIHDIGHLPLSHLFEEALLEFEKAAVSLPGNANSTTLRDEDDRRYKEFKKKLSEELIRELHPAPAASTKIVAERALHEIKGIMLVEELRTKMADPPQQEFAKLVLRLAKLIFVVNAHPSADSASDTDDDELAPLRCLHAIVASDLDADRLDYCVRDPQSSGLELGAIDVKRIVDSMVLHSGKKAFQILPAARASSAIEAFFHQRYQMYKNLIYHHNVVRMDGIAKQIIVRLLLEKVQQDGDEEIMSELDRFGLWYKTPRFGYHIMAGPIEQYEDAWLRTLMSSVFQKLDSRVREVRSHGNTDGLLPTSRLHHLWVLLDTYLNRKSENVFSLWKRESDYLDTIDKVAAKLGKRAKGYDFLVVNKYGLDFPKLVVDPLRRELDQHGVVLIDRVLTPKIFAKAHAGGGEEIRVLTDDGKVQDISKLSPYLASLQVVAAKAPNLHLSFVAERIKRKADVMDKCRELALRHLLTYAQEKVGTDAA